MTTFSVEITPNLFGQQLDAMARVTPQQFGTVDPTGIADSSAAFLAAIAALKTARTQPNSGYGSGSAELFIPAGTYNLGTTTLDLTHTMRLRGESGGQGGGATVLEWTVGTTGIRVQSFNTTGATGVITPNPSDITSGQGSIIEGLLLKGNYAGTESEAHAIHLRGNATIRDCGIYDFAGDGIHSVATAGSGGATEGNNNNSRFENLLIQGCRNGLFVDGADVNACTATSVELISNRQFGVWDSSFLGNSHTGHQAAGNGTVPGTHPPSWVSQGGNRYVVKRGQEAGASTNAPSGTATDNTWWYYFGAGAPSVPLNCPAWLSGTTYRAGGSFCTDDTGNAGNVFTGCYHEGSQPFAQFVFPTLILGGSIGANAKGIAVLSGGTDINSNAGFVGQGNLTMLGGAHAIGPQSGVAADNTIQLWNTNVLSLLWGRSTNGDIGKINFHYGTGIEYDASNSGWAHVFKINAVEVARFTSAGLTLVPVAVASLPAAGTAGRRSFVTDANATTFATIVAGGGANKISVYDDGTNWRIG